MTTLRIVTAQINPVVGGIEGNTDKILNAVEQAMQAHNPQLILFPELVVTGYPPEDLLLRSSISHRVERALARIAKAANVPIFLAGIDARTKTVFLDKVWSPDGDIESENAAIKTYIETNFEGIRPEKT